MAYTRFVSVLRRRGALYVGFFLLRLFSRTLLSFLKGCVPIGLVVCFHKTKKWSELQRLPPLPAVFANLPRGQHALYKLVQDFEFSTVLDVGSGAGEHALILRDSGKVVTALDFGTSVYAASSKSNYQSINRVTGNFLTYCPPEQFDCVWASHVLEHQPDPGLFIKKCIDVTTNNGVICIVVPPLKSEIVGGHLTLWNAGLLLYQLVFNGLDCSEASILSEGYNVAVIVRKRLRPKVELTFDKGDIESLSEFFPSFVAEPFDGRILKWNW